MADAGRPLRVGLVGASISGGWAMQSHVPALRAVPQCEIVAVATTRAESAAATAASLGVPRWYTDAGSLAADPDVDLVTVAVKVPEHDAVVRAVLSAGKAVYCEWPLGVDLDEARRIAGRAPGTATSRFIGLQARVMPELRMVRDLVSDGYVGRVLAVRACSAGPGSAGDTVPANREWATRRENGLTAVTIRGGHTLDAVTFAIGPLEHIGADVAVVTPYAVVDGTSRAVERTAPDQMLVTGRFASGASLVVQVLLGVPGAHAPLLTVHGTEGTLVLEADRADGQIQMSPLSLRGSRDDGPFELLPPVGDDATWPPPGPAHGVARQYAAIAARLTGRRCGAVPAGFDDAVRLHELLDAVERASTTGVRQRVG